jgi:hypothetical protein
LMVGIMLRSLRKVWTYRYVSEYRGKNAIDACGKTEFPILLYRILTIGWDYQDGT